VASPAKIIPNSPQLGVGTFSETEKKFVQKLEEEKLVVFTKVASADEYRQTLQFDTSLHYGIYILEL